MLSRVMPDVPFLGRGVLWGIESTTPASRALCRRSISSASFSAFTQSLVPPPLSCRMRCLGTLRVYPVCRWCHQQQHHWGLTQAKIAWFLLRYIFLTCSKCMSTILGKIQWTQLSCH